MSVDPKSNTQTLHRLSKDFHILLEDLNDLEATLLFLQELHRTIASTTKSQASLTNRANKISYLLSGCRNSRRWISNYNDRTNIRINLVSSQPLSLNRRNPFQADTSNHVKSS